MLSSSSKAPNNAKALGYPLTQAVCFLTAAHGSPFTEITCPISSHTFSFFYTAASPISFTASLSCSYLRCRFSPPSPAELQSPEGYHLQHRPSTSTLDGTLLFALLPGYLTGVSCLTAALPPPPPRYLLNFVIAATINKNKNIIRANSFDLILRNCQQ